MKNEKWKMKDEKACSSSFIPNVKDAKEKRLCILTSKLNTRLLHSKSL